MTRTVQLPPDPGLVDSLGARHSLHTALADLVDNSVDAGASRVRIIFETAGGRLNRVLVVDDGRGMDDDALDQAMTLGYRRAYGETDLGHFGMGLKASSFGHADTLTVWATAPHRSPVGRRIRRTDFTHDFTCEVLASEASGVADARRLREFETTAGTTVEWSDLRAVYQGPNEAEARTWLHKREADVRTHLGLTFHRLLESGRLGLEVRIDDVGGEEGVPVPVRALNPFGYRASGRSGYPKHFTADVGDESFTLIAHIWPPKSSAVEYRLGGSGVEGQGFYVYRNDRLLQVGGWGNTVVADPKRRLARVVLDGDILASGIMINADKHEVRFHPDLAGAIQRSTAADGTTFEQFLQDAEKVQVDASKRSRARKPAVMAEKGFAPALRRIISEELPAREQANMSIRWTRMTGEDFLEVDLPAMTLKLNDRYRSLFVTGRASLNDAPFLKAALYLMGHHLFEGERLGSTDKDNIALFNAVLTQAAQIQEAMLDGSE